MKLIEFGTISHIKKGKKPLRQIDKHQDGYRPYVDIEAFETGNVKMYTDGEKCLPCKVGDILIVCDGSRSGFVGKAIDGYVGSTLAIISADGMSQEYLYYFLQGKYALLNTKKKGTGTPHLDANILNQQKLVVPSLEEQKRIVAKIEELFSELDNGVETLKKTKQQLAVYRQAVYASVYQENDMRPITDFFEVSGGLTKNSKRNELSLKMPYLRVANVYYNELDLSEIKFIGVSENEVQKTTLKKDDLLFVEGNGSKEQIGRVAMWDGSIENCLHQNHLIKGRPLGNMLSQYALFYLISAHGRKQILRVASSTSGLYTLSTNKVRNLLIPFVDIENQKQCISIIEERLSVRDSIEKAVDIALQQAEAMRQSILKKAFDGEL